MKEEEIKEVHVLPYYDGTKHKNGKLKLKWIVKTDVDLKKEQLLDNANNK